jgi:rod shape-determining protein MreC
MSPARTSAGFHPVLEAFLLQRYFSALLLALYSIFCLACLSWSADSFVRTLRHTFHYLLSPASFPLVAQMDQWGSFGQNMGRLIRLDHNFRDLEEKWQRHRLDEKRFSALEEENQRLIELLNLKPRPRYAPLAARVWARDSNDWYHSLLIHRGKKDGVAISDPVICVQEGREVLVGQVIDVFETTSRVLLVTDSQSKVSARLSQTGEQGAVEGQGSRRLVMNYLFPDSDVRVGDEVTTAGLGHVFPEDILLGHVEAVEETLRESFKRCFVKAAVRLNHLEEVLVLHRQE